jgi:Fe-S-cluster containining protein
MLPLFINRTKPLTNIITDLETISTSAAELEAENEAFLFFLKERDHAQTDRAVHEINDLVSPKIDCTACGNCCSSLMINVTEPETLSCSKHLDMPVADFKEKYIEVSQGGQMIINTIPCHFLENTRCSIYENRFTECRDFPHLHKPGFTTRFFSTMMYYSMCPIIFNVVETLKEKLGFKIVVSPVVENE